jgi:hypothetical protein
MISHILLRMIGASLVAIVVGCTTTTSQTKTDEKASETSTAQGPKKKCREETITGSRIRKKVCDGDARSDNVGEVDKQTWNNEQKRVARPLVNR